jgi:hypothetical protein
MNCVNMTQDMQKWQALVNMVINLGIPQNAETFLTSFLRMNLFHATQLRYW